MKKLAAAVTAAAFLAGCATASKDIATVYVSPLQYQNYECDQLAAESARIGNRAQQLGARLDKAADNDKAIMAAGMILFWPALFALGGTKEQEAEFSMLKGHADAVQQTAIAKKCSGAMTAVPTATQPAGIVPTSAPAKQ